MNIAKQEEKALKELLRDLLLVGGGGGGGSCLPKYGFLCSVW